jgi:HEAT repeat protein
MDRRGGDDAGKVARPLVIGSTSRVKPISPRTIELVESLYASPGLLERWLRRVGPPSAGVLDEIVASGEIEAALGLLTLAVAGTPHYREPLHAALDRLVRAATPGALVWLEQRARTLSAWRREGWAWSRDVTAEVARSLPANPASAAGIGSMHHSGYVREAAVEVLSASDDPLAVAFLLIRVNDWVAPVRTAAARGIQAHLSRGGAARFVPYLELVDRLRMAGRNDLRPLAEAILGALATAEAASALRGGCASEVLAIRRRCFEIAFSARTFDLTPLIPIGLKDSDTVVRILTAKGAVQALEWADLEPFMDEMLASTTPAARFSALEAIWKQRGPESRALQERYALDPHPHVRGTARWLLMTIPGFDGRALYRRAVGAVSGERELTGAIEGLGEIGAPEDAALVLPLVQHQHARVRTAAVHALGSIGSEEHREAIVAALSDPSARVCRAARRVLLRGAPVDPERLALAALRSRYPHERRAAVELAGAHDHWIAGVLLLRIAGTSDAETAARASAALATWELRFNRVFTSPTRRQVQEFESLLDRANIDESLGRRLRALVPVLETRSK